ncbi:hypothetical protein [Herpetosiphon sp.]|nr:hypothetical protein [Herpetosiphon sp.]
MSDPSEQPTPIEPPAPEPMPIGDPPLDPTTADPPPIGDPPSQPQPPIGDPPKSGEHKT